MASSTDYSDLQDQISAARSVLLILASGYAAYGTIAFLAQSRDLVSSAADNATALANFLQNILIGVAFIACWRAARRAPLPALLTATLLWLGIQALGALVVSLSIFAGLWVKAVAAMLLLRGIIASVRARIFLRKLRDAA